MRVADLNFGKSNPSPNLREKWIRKTYWKGVYTSMYDILIWYRCIPLRIEGTSECY